MPVRFVVKGGGFTKPGQRQTRGESVSSALETSDICKGEPGSLAVFTSNLKILHGYEGFHAHYQKVRIHSYGHVPSKYLWLDDFSTHHT
tara:strand:+ start:132822 stop:133088 length:267 start_codon:yes stop_codon:yes gene_type:complete